MEKDPFKEYLRESEPDKAHKGYAWSTAIGLQAVDGLKPSKYLIDTAIQNIEGKITMKEAQSLIDSYYEERSVHLSDDERTEEADKVSSRIAEILSEQRFHFRQMSISLSTANFFKVFTSMLERLEIIILQRKNGYLMERLLCMAVFFIKYLRLLGFSATNDIFAENAWYFRNALVRANYTNLQKGIYETTEYLELFLRNLLLNEKNELHNRELHISGLLKEKKWILDMGKWTLEKKKWILKEFFLKKGVIFR